MKQINHTQIPNYFLDECLPKLKGSEIQVFLIICRQTIGWHKETDRISISQLEDKTGLSNRCIIDACRSLKNKELINFEMKDGIKSFEVCYEESSQEEKVPMKKVHRGHEESSQGAHEESSHTKETVTKETKQKKKIVATNVDDAPPKSGEYLDKAEQIATMLLDNICYWDPTHRYKKKDKAPKSWILEIERAMRIDGRTQEQLEFIIEYLFTQSSEAATFWAPNIHSGKKLRSKFDKIKNQIKKEQNGHKKTNITAMVDSVYK
jgi:phage replication O-like protein O